MNDDALLDLLRRSAATPDEVPDAAFVDALEQRLLAGPAHATVVPLTQRRRRLGRSGAIAVIAMVSVAGAAAAAGVVPNPFDGGDAAPAATGPETTPATIGPAVSTAEPDTSAPDGGSIPPPAPPTSAPASTAASTAPATSVVATSTSAAPTTVGSTTPSPTTEPQVPLTMTLTCTPDGSTVNCAWSTPTAPLDHYVVLRSGDGAGRAFTVPAGTTRWTDPMAVPGQHYTYLVHAMDAQDHSLGHSGLVTVDCCVAG